MKQFKITYALFGILCGFILNGCIDSGTSSNTNTNTTKNNATPDSINNNIGYHLSQLSGSGNSLHNYPGIQPTNTDLIPKFVSFAISNVKNGGDIIIAGEIIESQGLITLQLPEESATSVASPLYTFMFTGIADTILKDGVQVQYGDQISIIPNSLSKFTVVKGNSSRDYTVLSVLEPYFKNYNDPTNMCIQDSDGNVWLKFSPEWGSLQDTWPGDMYRITGDGTTNGFSACGIPVGKWRLPSLKQANSLLNKLPLAYRPSANLGNLEPTDWFNMPQHGFQLKPAQSYWTSQRDKKKSGNAFVMNISKQSVGIQSVPQSSQMYPLPFSGGSESSAKTITSIKVIIDNEVPADGLIVGNQIFVTVPTPITTGNTVNAVIATSTTGGTVSYNGIQLNNGNTIAYDATQPTPITVTAQNGDKNIYTLILYPPPSPKPATPGLLTICTSLGGTVDPTNAFNRVVIATFGASFYKQDVLPLPGTCSKIDMTQNIHTMTDLAANGVLWWSLTNETPLGSTLYFDIFGSFHDVIPIFKWVPVPYSEDPSGFKLSVAMDPNCHHDSTSVSGVTPSCTN